MNGVGMGGSRWGHLIADGWQQGALLPTAGLSHPYIGVAKDGTIAAVAPNLKGKDSLVIATQDCDIISNQEDHIEALVCKTVGAETLARVGTRSARRFVIDNDNRLVAFNYQRLQLHKDVLARLVSQPWPGDSLRFRRFVDWLARRYDKPALPDLLVQHFVNPLNAVPTESQGTPLGEALNRLVQECRINADIGEDPPYRVQLLVLLDVDRLSRADTEALDMLEDSIRARMDPAQINLDPHIRKASDSEVSMAEYWSSYSVYADYFSYKGDEVIGALPGRAFR